MSNKLNVYLSNLAVLNVKLHNLHWNVVGVNFMSIHTFTESLYDDVFEKYDEVAELLKIKGEVPLASVKDYLANTTVEELATKDFSTKEVLEILIQDLKNMKNLAFEVKKDAEEDSDFETSNMFEDHISGYNKNLWFLDSMTK
jgi:starvation-inducible DNA-binding protein